MFEQIAISVGRAMGAVCSAMMDFGKASEKLIAICDRCEKTVKEVYACERCEQDVCEKCLTTFTEHNQIDYNCCLGCSESNRREE